MRGPLQQLRLKINVAVYNNDVEGRRGFNGQKYIFEEFTLDNRISRKFDRLDRLVL